jgi:hypothetical protein
MNVFLVSSATSVRGESNTLSTSIFIAGPQMEDGTFATSYIPTRATTLTRAGDFASTDVNNFRYNPAEGTPVSSFNLFSPPIASLATF